MSLYNILAYYPGIHSKGRSNGAGRTPDFSCLRIHKFFPEIWETVFILVFTIMHNRVILVFLCWFFGTLLLVIFRYGCLQRQWQHILVSLVLHIIYTNKLIQWLEAMHGEMTMWWLLFFFTLWWCINFMHVQIAKSRLLSAIAPPLTINTYIWGYRTSYSIVSKYHFRYIAFKNQ